MPFSTHAHLAILYVNLTFLVAIQANKDQDLLMLVGILMFLSPQSKVVWEHLQAMKPGKVTKEDE